MKKPLLIILSVLLIGCTPPSIIIEPPSASTKIPLVCIVDNPKVMMKGFLTELHTQLKSYGIKTQTWTAYNPEGCKYWLEYTANWHWDFVVYLIYAELKLYDRTTLIGRAEYDNTAFWHELHYGAADDKLKMLTGPLFAASALQ